MPFDGPQVVGPITKTLIGARALLARRGGWCQRTLGDITRQQYCAVGAIRMAMCGTLLVDSNNLEKRVIKRLDSILGEQGLISWNDACGRRKWEVLELFDTAIHMNPEL